MNAPKTYMLVNAFIKTSVTLVDEDGRTVRAENIPVSILDDFKDNTGGRRVLVRAQLGPTQFLGLAYWSDLSVDQMGTAKVRPTRAPETETAPMGTRTDITRAMAHIFKGRA